MILRPATPADAADLAALEVAAFGPDGWPASSVAAELAAPARYVVVAVDAGAVMGWGVLLLGDPADVLRLAVAPHVRRQGLGRALLVDLLAYAGDRRVLLEVAAGNVAARVLYAGTGFVQIDRRPGYYGAGADAVVLSRAPGEAAPP